MNRFGLDGKTFYYLSEENGSFNIYRRTPGDAKAVQLTHYTKNPVRYLSAATDGRLCYGFDGEIYTLLPGGEAQKVNICIVSDRNDKDIIRQIKSSGATEMAVSPDGKEVAFVLRGDIYVTSVEYKTTKQITNTPYRGTHCRLCPRWPDTGLCFRTWRALATLHFDDCA